MSPELHLVKPDEELRLLESYAARGIRLVMWPRGADPATWKGPREEGWNDKSRVWSVSDYHAGLNIGMFTGHEIAPGKFLAEIDIDWAPGLSLALALAPKTEFGFGRASKMPSHLFYTTPERLVTKRYEDPTDGTTLIELRGGDSTQQTMVAPSLHPSGERIELWRDGPIAHVAADLTYVASLVATGMLLLKQLGPKGFRHEHRLATAGFLLKAGLSEFEVITIGEAIARESGNDVSDVAVTVRTTAERVRAGDKKVKGRRALAQAIGDQGDKVVARIFEWLGGDNFVRNADGQIKANSQRNIRTAFELLGAELSFDGFANKPLVRYDGRRQFLGDAVRNRLWLAIDEKFGFLPSQAFFDVVLQDAAHQNAFHPVRDYLASLTWDQVARLDAWLITYGGAADTEYVRAVGALVLTAAVRRVRHPGCKFDEMLILESSTQGRLKSTALRALCPHPEWFSDDLPLHVDAKQIIERTAGKWIIEAADLSGMNKTRVEHLKASLSRQVDGPVRLAYAHLPDEVPRQFVIIGTTNSHKYLKDSTGNRRFWPVRVERFDIESITRDRDQLWAEAATREATGVSIRLDPKYYAIAELQQERRRIEDPWEETLSEAFSDDKQDYRVTTDELFSLRYLNLPLSARREEDVARVAAIMERLGFEHKKARSINNIDRRTIKRWCRSAAQEHLDVD